jgi:hypothetical protein
MGITVVVVIRVNGKVTVGKVGKVVEGEKSGLGPMLLCGGFEVFLSKYMSLKKGYALGKSLDHKIYLWSNLVSLLYFFVFSHFLFPLR